MRMPYLTTVVLLAAVVLPPGYAGAQGFGRRGQPEVKLVGQFDRNNDGWLDADERAAARASLEASGRARRGDVGASAVASGPRLDPDDVTAETGDLYDPTVLRTLFFTFEADDWESELAAFYDTDVEVPATLVVDGRTYPDVGVAFRGNSSYSRIPPGYKRSFNVSIDARHDQQHVGGYRTLNLLNSHEDPTYLRTVLFSEIARQYIPAPKANHVRVVVNGESWGIYVAAEQFNRDFVEDRFGTRGGRRWKVPGSPNGRAGLEYLGENPAPYRRAYEIRTKDEPDAWADLIELCRVLAQTPPERLEAALAPLLDIDAALRFLALDIALVNADGYWSRASDYNLYQDPDGRFHVVPHDMNETFNVSGRGAFGSNVRGGVLLDPLAETTDARKPLRAKLLAVPVLRERYLGYVRDIAARWLDWDVLGPLAERSQLLILDDVREDPHKLDSFADFPADAFGPGSLRAFADRRREFLLGAVPASATGASPAPRTATTPPSP
ncbi:MAG: CotH kinase family protein [Vicinamibacterales bacterium]